MSVHNSFPIVGVSITPGLTEETPNLAVKLMSDCATEPILPVDRETPITTGMTALTNEGIRRFDSRFRIKFDGALLLD